MRYLTPVPANFSTCLASEARLRMMSATPGSAVEDVLWLQEPPQKVCSPCRGAAGLLDAWCESDGP